jgi:hypothetical protein
MLAIASSGLLIPYARLKESDHPSADTTNFKIAANQFNEFLETYFLDSGLADRTQNSWRISKRAIVNGRLDPGCFETEFKPISAKKQTAPIIQILRNALAHGNIVTEGHPIGKLFFLSKVGEDSRYYNCIAVSPEDFKLFIEKWFEFLGSIHMPDEIFEGNGVFNDDQAA